MSDIFKLYQDPQLYFPPYVAFERVFGTEQAKNSMSDSSLKNVVKSLIPLALSQTPFDRNFYLENNVDIKVAFESGHIDNLQRHYCHHGYFENRQGFDVGSMVDETWYLDMYKDVEFQVSDKIIGSGQDHFRLRGYQEWRIPSAATENVVRQWREALLSATLV